MEEVHVLDEPDRACPNCGESLAVMTGQYEESEEIVVVERRFVLRKHKRQKYRCRCGGCLETALGPLRLQPGGRYSLDSAIAVATQSTRRRPAPAAPERAITRDRKLTQRENGEATLWAEAVTSRP